MLHHIFLWHVTYALLFTVNPLMLELSAQCTLQKTGALNGCSLVCIFMASDLGDVQFSQPHTARGLESSSARGLSLGLYQVILTSHYFPLQNLKKLQLISAHLGFQQESLFKSAVLVEEVKEQVRAMQR